MEVGAYVDFENESWKDNEKGFDRMVQHIDYSVG